MKIYALRDIKVGSFMEPFCQANRACAIRTFTNAMKDERSQFRGFKEDIELYELGEYDDKTGTIKPTTPDFVLGGADV